MRTALKWVGGIVGWVILWAVLIACTPERSLVLRFGDNAYISIPLHALVSVAYVHVSFKALERERWDRHEQQRRDARDARWRSEDERWKREMEEIRSRYE